MQNILIIEDDLSFGVMLQGWLRKNGFAPTLCSHVEQAKREIAGRAFAVILCDLRLPDGDGIMLLAWMREQRRSTPVIIMTSYAEIQSAVLAIKLGASDFIAKPLNPDVLKQKMEQAQQSAAAQPQEQHVAVKVSPQNHTFITGKSAAAKQMLEHVRLVAPTQLSVMILGESGTGKEYVARAIHAGSRRSAAPFLAVDCGSLSKELASSELFGHLKGAFTSAIADKKGVFEQAEAGTVFFDEVGNLSYDVQAQLLRVLQERKVRPVGSATDLSVDVRIITATNENLETAIARGRFREDLYHRLNEFSITVPALRERAGDIDLFAAHFLEEANAELGKQVRGIAKDALQMLRAHRWSGNLRELRNVVRRAALFAQSGEILPEHLPILATLRQPPAAADSLALRDPNERQHIEEALKKAHGNKSLAAHLLQVDRKTLYNKMHRHGLA
ncbi:MAG: sigma-54 dependent transcriptional regulator [Prevotellaceae bacterium]|jgi:two-component system response regulator HydG|nr:sigma-54 dependent transcriptional regulator [Prevotellaceae bacterium]